eukprot:TRINITY_DN48404_c0_g1_i1.p1 TRINITY_DN48404_c0_g1~~TRINITY_DN48404_c0_g1_i1.p1  ORF type:complete len:287 (-),score=48.12 TRINITY_DN48404_c0_g1_i1:41-901(-)
MATRGDDIIRSLEDNSLKTLALEYTFPLELVKRIAVALERNCSVTTVTIGNWHAAGLKKKMPEGLSAIVAAVEHNYNITACHSISAPHGKYKEPGVARQVGRFVEQMGEIVKRNLEKCYLVSLSVVERTSDHLRVSCTSLGGDEMAMLEVRQTESAFTLYQRLEDTHPELLQDRHLVLLLPDGSILDASSEKPLGHALTTKDEVLELFRNFDLNSDGTISAEELQKVLAQVCADHVEEGKLEVLFEQMDVDRNGFISVREFLDFIFHTGDNADVLTLMNAAECMST